MEKLADQRFRSVPHRLTVTVSPIGPGAERAHFPGRTIRLQLQWADPSQRRRLSLIIDANTCGVHAAATKMRDDNDRVGLKELMITPRKADFSSLGNALELRIELNRSLEMFFGQLGHSEIFQPEAEHPMIKRIIWSELIGLFFVRNGFFDSAQ